MKPIRPGVATRWKLFIILLTAVLSGAAIAGCAETTEHHAVGASPAATGRPAVSSTTPPSSGCSVTYETTNWPGQFTAEVALTNTGTTPIDGWELTFTFSGDQAISSAWNATFRQTGRSVSATNEGYYDAAIPPGSSRSLGFQGTWQTDDSAPGDFRVNGTACT